MPQLSNIIPHPSRHTKHSNQLTYLEALSHNGPHFPIREGHTHVSASETTANLALPLGLREVPVEHVGPPVLKNLKRLQRRELKKDCAKVPKHDSELFLEGDLIRATTPFFSNVLEVVSDPILKASGIEKVDEVEWRSEMTFQGRKGDWKRPDLLLKYKDSAMPLVIIDYKGPDCIQVEELRAACAETVQEAKQRAEELAIEAIRKGKKTKQDPPRRSRRHHADDGHKGHGKERVEQGEEQEVEEEEGEEPESMGHTHKMHPSLFHDGRINTSMRNLVKQAVNYSTKSPCVALYDYNHLVIFELPQDCSKELIPMHICAEPNDDKAQGGLWYQNDQNHVAVAMRWIVRCVQAFDARTSYTPTGVREAFKKLRLAAD